MSESDQNRKLPLLEDKSGKYWFTDKQLSMLQSHRPSFISNNWGLIAFAISMIVIRAFTGSALFWALGITMMAVLAAIMLVAQLAIQEFESGHYRQAARLCNFGLLLGRASGHNWFAQMLLDQVQAGVYAREGKIVEAQLTYARWPLSRYRSLADTTLATLMSRGLCLERAAEIHLRRYEQVKPEETGVTKAIVACNVGFAYMMLNRPKIAKNYLDEAKSFCGNSSFELKVNILVNIARNNIQLGLLDEAETQLSELQRTIESRKRYMGQVVGELQVGFAELRYLQNQLEEALLHATSAMEFFNTVGVGDPLWHYVLVLQIKIQQELGQDADGLKALENFASEQAAIDSHNEAIFEQVQHILNSGNLIELKKFAQ